jgi:DNA-binding Lrp family transcriptional regulator
MVGLTSQAEADLSAFEEQARRWDLVRECHMLSGEVDFILKCVAPDLTSFQNFIIRDLTAAPNVGSVKTALTIRRSKWAPGAPFA